MILIAGLSLALALTARHFAPSLQESLGLCRRAAENRSIAWEHSRVFWMAVRTNLANTLHHADAILGGFLGGLVPAFLVVRGRRPRPRLPVILRQPGTLAVLAMIFGAFWITGLLDYLFYPAVGSGQWIAIDPGQVPGLAIGGSVIVAWAIVALSRRRQAEPGWIDRMGRWLGLAAIARLALGVLIHVVIPRVWW